MVNGYVNTESNYFMDSRLNILNQNTYSIPIQSQQTNNNKIAETLLEGHCLIDILRVYYEFGPMMCGLVNIIDFLPRFYSPTTTLSNVVNTATDSGGATSTSPIQGEGASLPPSTPDTAYSDCEQRVRTEKIPTTESLTRLIRRSLGWFESERKRILDETGNNQQQQHYHIIIDDNSEEPSEKVQSDGESKIIQDQQYSGNLTNNNAVNLKVCNLQVHQKTLLKGQLIQINPSNIRQIINTRTMAHERCDLNQLFAPIISTRNNATSCAQCLNILANNNNINNNNFIHLTNEQLQACLLRCPHLYEFGQAYQVKFIRLAYIVPVYNKYAIRSLWPKAAHHSDSSIGSNSKNTTNKLKRHETKMNNNQTTTPPAPSSTPTSTQLDKNLLTDTNCNDLLGEKNSNDNNDSIENFELDDSDISETASTSDTSSSSSSVGFEDKIVKGILLADGKEEEWAALKIVNSTNERHQRDEEAHQLNEGAGDTSMLNKSTSVSNNSQATSDHKSIEGSLIGQLTYRLFAPCQLVSSSSCFSINPINPSNPLARRGSVDLNGSGTNADNQSPIITATTSTSSLLKYDNNNCNSQQQPIVTSFGAFFPALTHDPIQSFSNSVASNFFSTENHHHLQQANANNNNNTSSSSNKHYTNNEFELVEAIRRRMEIYVTTNSMKVIAGETLIVNLSDSLSCLSTAIEQTIVRASFAHQRATSTWVSVYILYAAVDEPQLPSQLLAQQKLRELSLISEEQEGEPEEETVKENKDNSAGGQDNIDDIFDDDFENKHISNNSKQRQLSTSNNNTTSIGETCNLTENKIKTSSSSEGVNTKLNVTTTSDGIRIEQNPIDSSLTLYNSAYDRTVALPTQPDNNMSSMLEPIEFVGSQVDSMWLNENDLIEAQYNQHLLISDSKNQRQKKLKKKFSKKVNNKRHREDSQCSIM